VFIFDECHRSQFGKNHEAIKEFFPNAQLFGFTGTPIFTENATYTQIDGTEKTLVTTQDIFQKELHNYTITHAIDDKNVLRFHIDYFKPKGNLSRKADGSIAKQAVIDEILSKHDSATNSRRFNAVMATSSINEAIEYYKKFKEAQEKRQQDNPEYVPLNIACVFSPPAQLMGNGDQQSQKNAADIKQLQEDLVQEKEDYKQNPEEKKQALIEIIADYNEQYDTSHSINEFDLYYQDIQQRIKNQKYSNKDYPHEDKIDITIVVDMLLTGFDSKYLNTLYVDKSLKYHGLIQAFSRTNRVLNDSKPYGNILDFRGQEDAVETAIARFSGVDTTEQAKKIWLVDPAKDVIPRYEKAVSELGEFMKRQGLECKPEEVNNLRGDDARIEFITRFKEIQRLKTQLDQYTDIEQEDQVKINSLLPEGDLRAFRGAYLETAQQFRKKQSKNDDSVNPQIQELDFEFVLFASAVVDYDYIMGLIAKYSGREPSKQTMTKDQLIGIVAASADLMDERDDIVEYIQGLDIADVNGKTAKEISDSYQTFKAEKFNKEMSAIATKHGLDVTALQGFVNKVTRRMIFDDEQLSDLFEPLELDWKTRTQRKLSFMEDMIPLLEKIAAGREISGIKVYEN
jgi:type I restriction enzyme R subunit